MPRLLFDFPPGPGASPVRRIFRDPVEIVRATEVDRVLPALDRLRRGILEQGLSAAGYLAYEAAPAFDPAFRVRRSNRMPLLWFGLFEGTGAPAASPPPASHPPTTSSAHPSDAPEDSFEPFGVWELDTSREAFRESVGRIHRAIEAGETYQVNFTARMRARLASESEAERAGVIRREGGIVEVEEPGHGGGGREPSRHRQPTRRRIYENLRASQGDGYHALLELDGRTIVSASPELFFQLRGREVTVRPMKGTRPRGRWLEEDESLARELRRSEKEQAENRMIVDLLRNDLGRVAEIGSVEVPRVLDVERYRTVLQMTSTITGTLPSGADFVDALGALFPSGSVTGAPKIHTMGLIADLETTPREVYCGAIGYVEGGSGDAVFNVPIRTLWIDEEPGVATYGTGSGVTWSSTAEHEYDELRAKARILTERWPDFDLLEALRLQDGTYLRLRRHLSRMAGSATYFGRPFPGGSVRSALDAAARDHPDGAWKVRLLLSEDGDVQVMAAEITGEPFQGGSAARPGRIDSPAAEGREPDGSPTPDASRAPDAADAPPRAVALASAPVDSTDRWLFHKTTHRSVYDSRRADHPGAFDVLLQNERGEITEFTRGNVVLEMGGRRVTPPRSCGLLAGCFRQELLDRDVVKEERISVSELDRPEKLWLVNSVRGWIPVALS